MAQKEGKKEEKSKLASIEEEILDFWKEHAIFEQSLNKESPKGEFIFYEGPPTANGRPGIHHLLARSFKDVILRYKTMQGYHVGRRAGWDTHGLPVELEVEKDLGLKSKKEIEEYGIARFNQRCKENVWKYINEWEKFTDRIGYWLDQENPYITYEPYYIESVWWILKQVSDKKLLYKDYKVVPWCPRCGTGLSSHELAQGYEDVKDISITAGFKVKDRENTYILAWTTTPWTLPGNIALAVGEKIDYIEVKVGEEIYILAEQRKEILDGLEYSVLKKIKGKDLVGIEYEPLYPYLKDILLKKKEDISQSFKVYPADFVTTEDGTGIVHTAVMYGQDDFELGTKIGLPKVHLVGEDGKFLPGTGEFEGRFVKDEDLEISIIKSLHEKSLLFKKQKYEHSYPHCWRCHTPLIYYARDSWYIKMSDLRDKLVSENEGIHWEPEHIKEGRFGEWLREIKDWAISRERYWGTPLPIWETEDGEERIVIGSVDELKKYSKSSGNKYTLMRHGEAEHNVLDIISSKVTNTHGLTEKGKKEVLKEAQSLLTSKVDYIFASPFLRTKQTAEMIAKVLSLPEENIIFDERIREADFGDFDGKSVKEVCKMFPDYKDRYDNKVGGGESIREIKKRVGDFIYDIDSKYKDKAILIISHDLPLELLFSVSCGDDKNTVISNRADEKVFLEVSETKDLDFKSLPRNEDYELDLHKPYVDDLVLISPKSGKELTRVKEVIDVWFDSGAMPFAQSHYPFQNEEWVLGEGFPADYITEAIDQTRGWFYTLHAISNLLDRGKAYKNVICLGHIMDKDGKKMSKSVGNTINPWEAIDKFGADALRFWMYSINQPGESKNFDEKTIDEVVKKVFNLFLNVHTFYELHGEESKSPAKESENILDKWIIIKTNSLVRDITKNLDEYKVLEAARLIRDFIGDLSQWYLRRSRDRFKSDNSFDRESASQTTRRVLKTLCCLMAPFTPFVSESVYRKLRKESEPLSVHLDDWPEVEVTSVSDVVLLEDMEELREIASKGLMVRSKTGFKVRQPLKSITLKSPTLRGKEELLDILKDELNVKEVLFDTENSEEVLLDTEITPQLQEEGDVRELIRFVQDLRKERSLTPNQEIDLFWSGDDSVEEFLENNEEQLSKPLSISSIQRSKTELEKTAKLSSFEISFDIKLK